MKLGEFLYLIYDGHNRVRTVDGVFRTWRDQGLGYTAWNRRAFGHEPDVDDPSRKMSVIEVVSEIKFEWPDRRQIKSIEQRTGDEWTISAQPRQAWGIDLFDPAFLLSGYRFDHIARDVIAEREVVTAGVQARPDVSEHGFDHLDLLADIALDLEFGTILRAVWRYEQKEMQRLEFTRVCFT